MESGTLSVRISKTILAGFGSTQHTTTSTQVSNPFPIIFRLSFKSNNSYTMALLKEISRIPLHSEIFKHWEINYGQITQNHHPICHIMIYRLNTRYYIELSGWYTGKHFWSASASSSLLDLYFEVKAIADERTFRSLKDYERREKL